MARADQLTGRAANRAAGALAAAVALHTVLWLAWSMPAAPSRFATGQPGTGLREAPRLQARWLTATKSAPAGPQMPDRTVLAGSTDGRAAENGPPKPTLQEPAPPKDTFDGYLPRNALTQPPRPLEAPLLTYPDDAPEGRWQAELTLFIDANGQVRHLRIDTTDLPAALEQTARQAFMALRFEPGRVHDQPAPARIRIEVAFETEGPTRALRRP